MIILVSGGCKNGKTSIAEKIINNMSGGKNMYYIATMIPYDNEDKIRIARHIEERSKYNFKTIEIEDNINPIISELERLNICGNSNIKNDNIKDAKIDAINNDKLHIRPAFLFDSITAYLLNHIIDRKGEFDDDNLKDNKKDDIDFTSNDISDKVITDFSKLISLSKLSNDPIISTTSINSTASDTNLATASHDLFDIIFVSDYIYSDAPIYTDFVKYYARSLGIVDSFVAKNADVVLEVSTGNIIYHKGKENVEEFINFI